MEELAYIESLQGKVKDRGLEEKPDDARVLAVVASG